MRQKLECGGYEGLECGDGFRVGVDGAWAGEGGGQGGEHAGLVGEVCCEGVMCCFEAV